MGESCVRADPRPGARFDYKPVSPDVLDRALHIQAVCEEHDTPLRAAALRFPFGHSSVASVLIGSRTAAQVNDAVAMSRRWLPDALWQRLRAERLLPGRVPAPVDTQFP